jgi:trehalose 6-phosphate synthase/phosphatase
MLSNAVILSLSRNAQVGFHLFEYARHFLTCCRRLLGLEWSHEHDGINIRYGGRSVLVTCVHAGMDEDVVHDVLKTPQVRFCSARSASGAQRAAQVQADMHKLMQRTLGKTVIAGLDRMEKLKGIPLKLLAFERFLEANEQLRNKVVLYEVCLSAKERGADYDETRQQVRSAAAERANVTASLCPMAPSRSECWSSASTHDSARRMSPR